LFIKEGGHLVVSQGELGKNYGGEMAILPPIVKEWLGLETVTGRYFPSNLMFLSKNNDKGKTFEEIADIIESEPPGLFKEVEK
jgi:hypothetical protein